MLKHLRRLRHLPRARRYSRLRELSEMQRYLDAIKKVECVDTSGVSANG